MENFFGIIEELFAFINELEETDRIILTEEEGEFIDSLWTDYLEQIPEEEEL